MAVATLLIAGGTAEGANFVVDNTNPSGPGSLPEAASLANADTSTPDTITITATGTLNPNTNITLVGPTEINGPGARQLTINGQNAIRLFVTNGTPAVTLSGMTLTNALANSALCQGAAVMARDGGSLTLRNMSIRNNTTTCSSSISLGGAIYSAGPLTVENSTIANNTVNNTAAQAFGGAFYAPSGATIRSSTITGNQATGVTPYGGGVFVEGLGAAKVSSIRNSTIAGNTAANAANLYVGTGHTASIRSAIVANPLGGGGDCTNAGALTSDGFNLISDASCSLNQATDTSGNPQLGPLADNGGPTDTMLPAATSPVVDHGTSSGLSVDQRGLGRPADLADVANGLGSDGSDIGAVELQAPTVVTPAAGDVSLGKAKLNKKKGTATVSATVNGAGVISLAGDQLKATSATIGGPGTVELTLKAKGKAKKALKKKGKAKVTYTVSFTPASGSPDTAEGRAKLKRKRKAG